MISRTYFLPMLLGRTLGPVGRGAAIEQLAMEASMLEAAGLQAEADERRDRLVYAKLEDSALRSAGR